MAGNSFVRARIDEWLKNEAAAVLAEMGLSVSDVVRIVLTRIAKERAFPLELKVPNEATRAAMKEARALMRTRTARFATSTDLFDALAEDARGV